MALFPTLAVKFGESVKVGIDELHRSQMERRLNWFEIKM